MLQRIPKAWILAPSGRTPCPALERGPRCANALPCSLRGPSRKEQPLLRAEQGLKKTFINSISYPRSAHSSQTFEESGRNHIQRAASSHIKTVPWRLWRRRSGPQALWAPVQPHLGDSSPLRTTSSKGMSLNSLWYCWLYLLSSVCKHTSWG